MLLCLLKNENANHKHETSEFCKFQYPYSGLKYPPSCFSVYLENKNAYLKQETSEIVVKSIHHGGFLFNFIIINLKSSENKERWRLSTVSNESISLDALNYVILSCHDNFEICTPNKFYLVSKVKIDQKTSCLVSHFLKMGDKLT